MSTVVNNISPTDEAQSLLIYSKDCIYSGRLLEARKAINKAIKLLPIQDKDNVDNVLLRLIQGGINDR